MSKLGSALPFLAFAACLGFAPSATAAQADLPFAGDAHELVTGAISVPSTPAERATAFSLLERALQNSDMHMPGAPPFYLEAWFNAGGNVRDVGSGVLTETWLSGRNWSWAASLGGYSQIQVGSSGAVFADKIVPVPMRLHMLRNAIFWPVRLNSAAALRTAAVHCNGRPATCLLLSGVTGQAAATQTRLWQETEYCVDNASGLLEVYSVAPGSYTVYSYAKNLRFHGRSMPDQITFFVRGAMVLDSQIRITDPGPVSESLLSPTPQMTANGPAVTLSMPERFPINVPSASTGAAVKSVIVHAEIDLNGNVLEGELVSAADPALADSALDLVKNIKFPAAQTQRQAYVNVRYLPQAQ
jgi:hypothetical protein